MSGLSDSDWEEFAAVIDGEPAAEPSPAEPETPQTQAQTATEQTAPDGPDAIGAAEPAVEEPDPRIAEIEAREAALAERERVEALQRQEAQARYQAWQEAEAEKRSNAYYQQLVEENGQEVANQYLAMRQGVVQQRRDAEARANGAELGLTAAMIALEQVVGPEQVQQVLELTGHLVTYQSADQMQSVLMQERQRIERDSAEKQAMQRTIMELRARVEAQERPAAADAVDRGAAGPGTGNRPEDASDFNTFFERLFA